MSGPSWTEVEIASLQRQWCEGVDTILIAESIPGRSISAVQQKAHQMGLRRPDSYIRRVRAHACRAGGYGGRRRA